MGAIHIFAVLLGVALVVYAICTPVSSDHEDEE